MCCRDLESPSFKRTLDGIDLNAFHYIDDHWVFASQYAKREQTCLSSLLVKPSGNMI